MNKHEETVWLILITRMTTIDLRPGEPAAALETVGGCSKGGRDSRPLRLSAGPADFLLLPSHRFLSRS